LREDKIQTSAMHINHMQKAMTQMNIRLTEVLSEIHGVSSLAMISAILKGQRDPKVLLSFCYKSLQKNKSERIIEALNGNYKSEYLFHENFRKVRHWRLIILLLRFFCSFTTSYCDIS
jgi:hypothetical protein